MIDLANEPYLQSLHLYWLAACGARSMPCRADIDPTEIPTLLPYIFLVDICAPLTFRFRLVGSAICQSWGMNPTGKLLTELDFDGESETILRHYADVAHTGRPRHDTEEFVSDGGRYLHYHRLLMPLSSDDRTPTMLLGGLRAIGIEGFLHTPPKRI